MKEKEKELFIKEVESLHRKIDELEKETADRREVRHNLGERVKELSCLYGISKLLERPAITLKEIIQGIVDLIPPAWQYPDITCSRIVFEDYHIQTENFKTSKWSQSADIRMYGTKAGIIEVYYLEQRMDLDEGPFLKEEQGLINIIAERLGKIIIRLKAEEQLLTKTHELAERVKELSCLHGLSRLIERGGITVTRIIQGLIDLIPPAWQYPEITCARILLDGRVYQSEHFKEAVWRQCSDIVVHGKSVGSLEVYYKEEKPDSSEGPFLKEERNLINVICGRLGTVIERDMAEQALMDSELELRKQKEALEQKNITLREVLAQIELEKKEIENNVMANVDMLLLPILEGFWINEESQKHIDLLRSNLEDLTSSFGRRISEERAKLTSREIEICNMIKNGLRSKEISTLLVISVQTVEKHRAKIRNKLGISNTRLNLASFLHTL